jgi:hypothetical protein
MAEPSPRISMVPPSPAVDVSENSGGLRSTPLTQNPSLFILLTRWLPMNPPAPQTTAFFVRGFSSLEMGFRARVLLRGHRVGHRVSVRALRRFHRAGRELPETTDPGGVAIERRFRLRGSRSGGREPSMLKPADLRNESGYRIEKLRQRA